MTAGVLRESLSVVATGDGWGYTRAMGNGGRMSCEWSGLIAAPFPISMDSVRRENPSGTRVGAETPEVRPAPGRVEDGARHRIEEL